MTTPTNAFCPACTTKGIPKKFTEAAPARAKASLTKKKPPPKKAVRKVDGFEKDLKIPSLGEMCIKVS